MVDHVLHLNQVYKAYPQAQGALEVLCGVDLKIKPKESVALVGPSGCGKSTLLQIAGLLDTATSGEIVLCDVVLGGASDKERTKQRQEHIGFVYQFHHLLPEFTALENVAMPLVIAGKGGVEAASALLERVGLKDRMTHRPSELSGGEKQRVAIARALVHKPSLLIADEPTGNLDPHLADEMFQLITDLVKERGMSAIIATHNVELAKKLSRVITLTDGVVETA